MLPTGALFELRIHQNAFVARDSSRTPLGELTALPKTPSWFFWGRFTAGEGRGGEEKGCGKGRGAFTHLSFLKFNHCLLMTVNVKDRVA